MQKIIGITLLAVGIYTYTLLKSGNEYYLMFDGDVCIEYGERDGKKLETASRLKIFSQITMSMWGLIQSGEIT